MKRQILLILILLTTHLIKGQTVLSSCSAPDSIKVKYEEDADRLAMQKFYRQGLSYADSIEIPQTHSDTVMNALIAVYNAISLPARDTVISMYNIHTRINPTLTMVSIYADSTLLWMQQLKAGNIQTGNSFLDSLIVLYRLNTFHYVTNYNLNQYQVVYFTADSNLNILPLTVLFEMMGGVFESSYGIYYENGKNITDSIYSDHVNLKYSLGWGDCPMGCTQRRFWEFNVYFDCSVEYVGSYGSILFPTGLNEIDEIHPRIYPNPAKEIISVELNTNQKSKSFYITDLPGRTVLKGNFQQNKFDVNVSALSPGVYLLYLENQHKSIKFIKE